MWPPPSFHPRHYQSPPFHQTRHYPAHPRYHTTVPKQRFPPRVPPLFSCIPPRFPPRIPPPFFHRLSLPPRIGFLRPPIVPTPPAIAPPAIVINQHFHYHGEHSLPERAGGEQEIVSDIQTEVKVKEKEMVQGIILETELKVQDIAYEDDEDFQDSRDQVLENELYEEVEAAHPDKDTTQCKQKLAEASATSSSKRMRRIPYPSTEFTSLLSMTGATAMAGERVEARSRKWSAESNSFGAWMTIHRTTMNSSQKNDDSIDFVLRRGGLIKFFPNLVDHVDEVKQEMLRQTTYKQYKVRECGNEPRLHALYCSPVSKTGGYRYGRVQMGSHPLESLPVISGFAEGLASKFGLLNNHWNIGCHLVLYRDGKDSIHWHADDTQGEDVILSLTVDGPAADARTISFQPATAKLKTGDEQLELYPIPGDGYSMDGKCASFLRSCDVEDSAITHCHDGTHAGHYIPKWHSQNVQ